MAEDIQYSGRTLPIQSVSIDDVDADSGEVVATPVRSDNIPPPILSGISEENMKRFTIWVDDWLNQLENENNGKLVQWAAEEKAYRAKSLGPRTYPFKGACGDVVPAIAMAVDPIFARLDVGIFKTDRVFRITALKKSTLKASDALERWIQYYQKNQLKLREVCQPRLLEEVKHGTMILKTIYDDDTQKIRTYDPKTWKVIERTVTRFKGPRVLGVSIGDMLFPTAYQNIQDAPIVFERQRVTYDSLLLAQAQGKLKNCEALRGQETDEKNLLETERERSANKVELSFDPNRVVVFEGWCLYDINNDGMPEKVIFTYHKDTATFLQLRYNWYFHQRYPYTVIPYQLTNDSILGLGLCEMILPFQDMSTQWHRMATDNAYLANIRMFIARKESGIENPPELYSGRTFFVDDPTKDLIPFQAADVYPSTLSERQNIMGLVEKRTGVSDYLTGRESPIVGSRATATSTLALIKEGTQRVEEVLENLRVGLAEVIQNCLYIWIQFGLEGLDDLVFGDDEMVQDLKDFFDSVDEDNVHGAIAIDLGALDASNNRSAQQQMQLAIIQTMMQYLQKLLEAGQSALQSLQSMPEYASMIGEVMTSARKMFRDLLVAYNIPNPEEYLPDLEQYLNAARQQQAAQSGEAGGQPQLAAGAQGQPSLPNAPASGPRPTQPSAPGAGSAVG